MARWQLDLGLLLRTLALTLTFPSDLSLAFAIPIAGSIAVADRAAGGRSLMLGDDGGSGLGRGGTGVLAVSDKVLAWSATATTAQTASSLLNASITAPVGMVDVCEWRSEVCAEGHQNTLYITPSICVISPVIAPDVRAPHHRT